MKRILSLGLVLTMICTLLTFMPATAASIIDSGTCGAQGDNLKWTLDSEGILTISGTGEMKDYGATGLTASPWGSYNSKIKKIIIGNRITNIGTMAFWFCNNLTDITIPQGVTSIGMGAFAYCTALKEISLPDSITFMGSGAFIHCDNIKNMYIPSIESWLKIDLEDIETSPVSFKDNACVYINGKLAKKYFYTGQYNRDWQVCFFVLELP